jgi:hypothetical protein
VRRVAIVAAVVVVVATGARTSCDDTEASGDDELVCGDGSTLPKNAPFPEDIPEPNDTCLPACGNAIGVGQPCTRGGGECSGYRLEDGEAIFCTVDFDESADLSMCTKPCINDDQCGDDAICTSDPEDPGDRGCVPAACVED